MKRLPDCTKQSLPCLCAVVVFFRAFSGEYCINLNTLTKQSKDNKTFLLHTPGFSFSFKKLLNVLLWQ